MFIKLSNGIVVNADLIAGISNVRTEYQTVNVYTVYMSDSLFFEVNKPTRKEAEDDREQLITQLARRDFLSSMPGVLQT